LVRRSPLFFLKDRQHQARAEAVDRDVAMSISIGGV
jgi:hypothetical protein